MAPSLPAISYLVSTCGEPSTQELIDKILQYKSKDDEIVVLIDSDKVNVGNLPLNLQMVRVVSHPLNKNYGEHKNYGKTQCWKEWIFQLDADELPSDTLLLNVKDIIQANAEVEAYWIPRINDFRGINFEHARLWGWRLTEYRNGYICNYPDFQCRLFRNSPQIKWDRPLHEKIEGAFVVSTLPAEFDYELYLLHTKTIEQQIAANVRYNQDFSWELNRGFDVYCNKN
jgi:hypothetical protein